MNRKQRMHMDLPTAPVPASGFLVTHFLTVADQVRSREFYVGVLGGTALTSDSPCVIKLANSWVILNGGGGSTPDKPDVTLQPPSGTNQVSSFLNLRVADIQSCYDDWTAKGAEFITEPLDNHGWETRCYMRDPDGYIIEVGQASPKMIALLSQGG
jgi:predicted enzyme related to lactoylglutathione lyase